MFFETVFIERIDLQIVITDETLSISDCYIAPINVPIPEIICNSCGANFRLMPSFFVAGTTLTLAALLFIASVYHSAQNGWRRIAKKHCSKEYGIVHTTLYRGYHALGDRFTDTENASIELESIYQNAASSHEIDNAEGTRCSNCNPLEEACISSIPRKARKDNRKKTEKKIIKELLLLILSIGEEFNNYYKNLWSLADVLIHKPAFNSKKVTSERPHRADTS